MVESESPHGTNGLDLASECYNSSEGDAQFQGAYNYVLTTDYSKRVCNLFSNLRYEINHGDIVSFEQHLKFMGFSSMLVRCWLKQVKASGQPVKSHLEAWADNYVKRLDNLIDSGNQLKPCLALKAGATTTDGVKHQNGSIVAWYDSAWREMQRLATSLTHLDSQPPKWNVVDLASDPD